MISANSRYANCKIELLVDAANPTQPKPTIIPTPPHLRAFNYTEYQVVYGDRVDNLAYSFLNDPGLWWVIANANPEITLWIDLVPGTILRIPRV